MLQRYMENRDSLIIFIIKYNISCV